MSTNKTNQEEEIDLGSLFKIIGKGFSNLFNFIANIFKGIFHFIITFLIFIKQNIIKISVATILGAAIGAYLQFNTPTQYASDLLVEPNFKSVMQLYNNVQFYNDLVKQKDTLGLAKTFNLSKEDAASIKKFTVVPVINENDIINAYNEFVLEVDTTTVRSYDFESFKAAFKERDYKYHNIHVVAEKNNVFTKLDDIIINSVVNNNYFKRVKELTNKNLDRTDSVYVQNLAQLDSLRKVYMTVLVEEAKKQSSGTSIDLGGKNEVSKESELFNNIRKINYDLKELTEEKSKKYEVINVISNFQPIGYKVKGITKNYILLLGIAGAFLTILILLLIKLNTYLDNYKKE